MTTAQRVMRRLLWIGVVGLAAVGIAYLAREPILTKIGSQLVRTDSLARADAIVVLGGGTPLREIEAADLYRAGYAPRLVMAVEREPPGADLLRARGVPFDTRIGLRKRVVTSLGVPDAAVTLLDQQQPNSTRMEAELVRDWVATSGATRIIIVTSGYHTARASLIFRRVLGGLGVEVLARSAQSDPFRASDWWKDRDELRNGIIEWQKLLFYYVAYR